MSELLLLALSAAASDHAWWGDPLIPRPCESLEVSTPHGVVLDADRLWSGALRVGSAVPRLPNAGTLPLSGVAPASVHWAVDAGTVTSWTDDGRSFVGLRSLGVEVLVLSERTRWGAAAVGFRGHKRLPGASNWFLVHDSERADALAWVLQGRTSPGPVQLTGELRLGLSSTFLFDAMGTGFVWLDLTDRVALGGGATAGWAAQGVAVGGLRARPADEVEVGLVVAHGIPVGWIAFLPGPNPEFGGAFPMLDVAWRPGRAQEAAHAAPDREPEPPAPVGAAPG